MNLPNVGWINILPWYITCMYIIRQIYTYLVSNYFLVPFWLPCLTNKYFKFTLHLFYSTIIEGWPYLKEGNCIEKVNCKLLKDMGCQSDANLEIVHVISFENAIGNLMYVMVCIKPNIVQAMVVVSQFIANFRHSHWILVKQIFRHLKSVMDFGLCFRKNIKDVIIGKVHFDNDVNHNQGQAHFKRNVKP